MDVSQWYRFAIRLLPMAAIAAATQLVSVAPWTAVSWDHMLWLPGAALMCVLLWRPYPEWPACLLGAFLGAMVSLLVHRAPVLESAGILTGLLLLVAVAVWTMRSLRRCGPPLEDYQQVSLFLATAVAALPLASAGWIHLLAGVVDLPGLIAAWPSLVLPHALTYLLVVPLFVGLRALQRHPERRPPLTACLAVLDLALLLILWTAWVWPWSSPVMDPLLILAATMFLVWTLLTLGTVSAFLTLLCSALLCMAVSSRGWGPLAYSAVEHTTLAVQLWALSEGILLALLTVLAEQRRSSRLSLGLASVRLADLTGRMLHVQEEERTRIARELHDDINQSLASVSIQLSSLKRTTDAGTREQVEKLQEQLLSVSGDVRRLSHDLHPSLLRYTSLAVALRGLCEGCHVPARTRIQCDVADGPPLDEDQKLNLFRIAQEAIHNINRHAHAQHAWITLRFDAAAGMLEVQDNGIGVDVGRASRGLGMISIEERARLLGGSVLFERRQEGGSRLLVCFPMRRPRIADRPSVSA